jgi:hypothetical protein
MLTAPLSIALLLAWAALSLRQMIKSGETSLTRRALPPVFILLTFFQWPKAFFAIAVAASAWNAHRLLKKDGFAPQIVNAAVNILLLVTIYELVAFLAYRSFSRGLVATLLS